MEKAAPEYFNQSLVWCFLISFMAVAMHNAMSVNVALLKSLAHAAAL
jgi:hypothetical protein